jgi:hypothetical protein
MKRYKVEGWYRSGDEKDFEQLTLIERNAKKALMYFYKYHIEIDFYKITVEEINNK